ncbi:MAG: UvrB/UvrC motif-containing protein [Planctomycetota bacterium]|nr:UvrB/UvrC motif-containing protein [Planctomycetota bacterium]
MLCEICKKRVATLHITEIGQGGAKQTVHICEECARSQGLLGPKPAAQTLQQLLQQVVEQQMGEVSEEVRKLKCSKCGITYEEFRKGGRFGCAEDYKVFEKTLTELFERLHGASEHRGKEYKKCGERTERAQKIIEMRRKLGEAVKEEDYETAAKIRDELKRLEEEEEQESKKKKS